MLICHRCDLRKMGNTDHLMISSDHCHLLRHFLRRSSADPHIDLIKDQCLDLIFIRHDCLDCKHDAGKFTAGYHFRQRSQRFSGIRGNSKTDFVISVCRVMLCRFEINLKFHIQKIQILQALNNSAFQLFPINFTQFGQFFTDRCQFCLCLLHLFFQFFFILLKMIQSVQIFLFFFLTCQNLFYRRTVFCLHTVKQIQSLLRLIEFFFRKCHAFHIITDFPVHI